MYNNENNKMIHIIGKDIIWVHSVIYPAILQACNHKECYPNKILVHGFILDKDGKKMSKSLNNVISNDYILNKYPIEAIRFYFITTIILGQDLKFNEDVLIATFNNVLLKSFGNLFQRMYKIILSIEEELNNEIILKHDEIANIKISFNDTIKNNFLTNFNFSYYNDILNEQIFDCNKIITEKEPWKLNNQGKLIVMFNILVKFNISMCLMFPIIPNKIIELATYIGWENKLDLDSNIILKIKDPNIKVNPFTYIKK